MKAPFCLSDADEGRTLSFLQRLETSCSGDLRTRQNLLHCGAGHALCGFDICPKIAHFQGCLLSLRRRSHFVNRSSSTLSVNRSSIVMRTRAEFKMKRWRMLLSKM